MPRVRQAPSQTSEESRIQQYVKLEARLVLLAWLNGLFGYEHNRDLLTDMKEADEGFDAQGHSYIYHRLIARGSKLQISSEDLSRYDENIRRHLAAINAHRPEPVTLRYFQYLAVLYAEIFLNYYFNRRNFMLASLNEFVANRNSRLLPGEPRDTEFTETDLQKLAFWMATGSGKTIIMHFNYHQFLHYNTDLLDNILLITPNEGLSEQHLQELAASGIPAKRFDLSESGLLLDFPNTVRIIEITKLVEEKRGGGVSVPVEAFEGNNLIFVDEGHKGSGGEAWRGYRDALGETGFTFEYSATFGQALTASRNDLLTMEYGKAICFDYSYRYFYGDGFGKDFRVLNIREETTDEQTETLLMGNLLSFFEQQRIFGEEAVALQPYQLERPLWVFVGSTVNVVYTEGGYKRSDVLTVVRFLQHVLNNRSNWAVNAIQRLMEGGSGITTPDGRDVFANQFAYLRGLNMAPGAIYSDILMTVFHTPTSGNLHLCDIRNGAGEIALKASGAEEYFGLIYIGDTSAFMKLVEDDASEMILEEDAISNSLFGGIHSPNTKVEILIGAKKFMEGWNSWRVSNMGLLNIGRNEGPLIIQLFGRGVRLRGIKNSLKRSSALAGEHPPNIRILETLNVFAVRANHMEQFRVALEKEGVEPDEPLEMPLLVWTNQTFLDKGLVVPRVPDENDFNSGAVISLEYDSAVQVRVDMSMKVETIESSAQGFMALEANAGLEQTIPEENLVLVDWERVYLDLLEYKERKGMNNLIVTPGAPRRIVETTTPRRVYHLVADEPVVRPTSFYGRRLLQKAVTNILCRYTDAIYRVRREQWESKTMVYRKLDENDPNLAFNVDAVEEYKPSYIVRLKRAEAHLVEAIQELLDNEEGFYKGESGELPRIYFDRHLYLPLLLQPYEESGIISSTPPGLSKSEAHFVRDLREFWEREKDCLLESLEVFLLRNMSRGKGIGYFVERGFYPDFILWIVKKNMQNIIFIEPHGMLHAPAYQHDEKARLHEQLPVLAKEIAARSKWKRVTLDSYIVSATSYEDLHRKYDDGTWSRDKFAGHHILFPERNDGYDYLQIIFEGQLLSDTANTAK